MDGLMQEFPLTLNWIAARAAQYFAGKQVVTRTAQGIERSPYSEVLRDARRIAGYLDSVGISADGRVGTFGWNTAKHLALYLAIPGSGRVMHTLNIRYFPEQLIYTVDHAEDEVIFVDRSLLPLLGPQLPQLGTVRQVVVMDDGADVPWPDDPRLVSWDDVIGAAPEAELADRVADERRAAAICYTTGTRGHPKGALHSHTSTGLPANAATASGVFGLHERDRVLPVVPMFH